MRSITVYAEDYHWGRSLAPSSLWYWCPVVQGHLCIILYSLQTYSKASHCVSSCPLVPTGLDSSGYLHLLANLHPFPGSWHKEPCFRLRGDCGSGKSLEGLSLRAQDSSSHASSLEIHLVWKKKLHFILEPSATKTPRVNVSTSLGLCASSFLVALCSFWQNHSSWLQWPWFY